MTRPDQQTADAHVRDAAPLRPQLEEPTWQQQAAFRKVVTEHVAADLAASNRPFRTGRGYRNHRHCQARILLRSHRQTRLAAHTLESAGHHRQLRMSRKGGGAS